MSTFSIDIDIPDPRSVGQYALDSLGTRKFILVQAPAQSEISSTLPTPTTPGPQLTTDQSQSNSVIAALQAELNAANSVNTRLAASVARLQAELNAANSVINHLATTVARFQAEQALPPPATTTSTSTTTTTTISAPLPCSHPDHPHIIASGRGAASPEVFQEIIKTNWHGRLGRTHMAEVDTLPTAALTELDSLLRRKLHQLYPRDGKYSTPEADIIFASLAALGLRLEDRSAYADLPDFSDNATSGAATLWRGRHFAGWYYSRDTRYVEYWKGSAVETLLELAKYRGLFDAEGFLKVE